MDLWGNIAKTSSRELREQQNNKLQRFITQYIYPFSPHYRRIFDHHKIDPRSIKTVEDLQRIPFTSKADFIKEDQPDKFKDFILQPSKEAIKENWPTSRLLSMKCRSFFSGGEAGLKERLEREFRPSFITFTTGTTNRPISYLYTSHDIQNLFVSGSRMLTLFDIQRGENVVNMFPFAPHLAFWQVVFGGLSASTLIMSTGGGKVMGTEGNIAVLEKMRPSVILGVPSYVYHVMRVAQAKGCRMDFIQKVVLGASKIPDAFKIRLAELLASMGAKDVSVFGTYGFTEARSAWAECPTGNDISSGYHLYSDKEIFEVIDPNTGAVVGDGEEGELVYTSLDSRGSSVIRYRTGDLVKGGIVYDPCPHCGRTVPRITSDITRISEMKSVQISKIKGCLVNFNNFAVSLQSIAAVEEWQIELCKKDNDPYEVDQLMVYICPKPGVNLKSLEEEVKTKILMTTEISANGIRFLSLEEMVKRLELETANKEKRIVDKRPLA